MVVLLCITFVDGSELEFHVSISLVLSEVSERRDVVVQDGRAVVIKQVIGWQLSEVLKIWEHPLEIIKVILLWEQLEEISRPNIIFSYRQNVAELAVYFVEPCDIISNVFQLSD